MILGLTGKMRAGKNTCAERLAKFSPLPVVEVSFAAKLKESAAALLGVSVADLERMKNDAESHVRVIDASRSREPATIVRTAPQTYKFTIRELLQRYGTEAHRDVFGYGFWLDAALPTAYTYDDALYVVTDVRFENEAQRVKDLGGWNVLVIGPEDDTGSHASEQPLQPHMIEATIFNAERDDDFSALDRQLSDLMFMAFGGSRAA